MSALTIRMLEQLCHDVPDDMKDLPVIVPSSHKPTIPGAFAFEEVCPGISGLIGLGPSFEFIEQDEVYKNLRHAFLIAPHSFHENEDEINDDEEKQKILN